jgi:hypothetical protein
MAPAQHQEKISMNTTLEKDRSLPPKDYRQIGR